MFEAEQKSLSTWERHWTGPEIDWTRRSDSTAWSKTERWVLTDQLSQLVVNLATHTFYFTKTHPWSYFFIISSSFFLFHVPIPGSSILFIYFFVMLPLLLLFCFICLTFQRLYSSSYECSQQQKESFVNFAYSWVLCWCMLLQTLMPMICLHLGVCPSAYLQVMEFICFSICCFVLKSDRDYNMLMLWMIERTFISSP